MEQCPQCGEPTASFFEGLCRDCCESNQESLDSFNNSYDWWESLSDDEKDQQISNAY